MAIEHVNDVLGRTTDYYFDGAKELAEYRGSGDGDRMRYSVHGVAYIDEHLMMMVDKAGTSNDRPYYYVQDRLYNVWAMIDRAGAIVERYAYDAYGLPLIRESAGRGDMNNDTLIDADPGTDKTRMLDARDGVIWDPRADMDDDGDVDDDDVLLWSDADNVWPESEPTVAQAFSDVGNPFMFQGVRHFALDTADDAESATLPLNHHRARFADPVTGRWGARDPVGIADSANLYSLLADNPTMYYDTFGMKIACDEGDISPEDFDKLADMFPPCCIWTSVRDKGLQIDCTKCPPNALSEFRKELLDRLIDILDSTVTYIIHAPSDSGIRVRSRAAAPPICITLPWEFLDMADGHFIHGYTVFPKGNTFGAADADDDKFHIWRRKGISDSEDRSAMAHELLGHGWPAGKGTVHAQKGQRPDDVDRFGERVNKEFGWKPAASRPGPLPNGEKTGP